MSENNKWYFYETQPLPSNLGKWVKAREEGKEIYGFQCDHAVHGLIAISVLASNIKEAQIIIDEVTK